MVKSDGRFLMGSLWSFGQAASCLHWMQHAPIPLLVVKFNLKRLRHLWVRSNFKWPSKKRLNLYECIYVCFQSTGTTSKSGVVAAAVKANKCYSLGHTYIPLHTSGYRDPWFFWAKITDICEEAQWR